MRTIRFALVATALLVGWTLAARPAMGQCPTDCAFDLEAEGRYDSNLIPLNPKWHGQSQPWERLDPEVECESFTKEHPQGTKQCTQQEVTLDGPGWLKRLICGLSGGGGFKGHINWGPATFVERLEWTKIAADGDYNWDMLPVDGRLLTVNRETLHTEAHGKETINRFETTWWKGFVRAYHPEKVKMLRDKHAVITGLVNLDNVHGAYSELHPIYVLAILIERGPAEQQGYLRDFWVVFLRNWGDQGFCSRRQHYLIGLPEADCGAEMADERCHWLGVDLPLPGVQEARLHDDTLLKSNLAIPDAHLSFGSDAATVRFVLPELEPGKKTPLKERPIVHGELHLVWRPEAIPEAMAAVEPPAALPTRTAAQPTEETLFGFLYSQASEVATADRARALARPVEPESFVDVGIPVAAVRALPPDPEAKRAAPLVQAVEVEPTEEEIAEERRDVAVLCDGASRTLESENLLGQAQGQGIDPGSLEQLVEACREEGLIE